MRHVLVGSGIAALSAAESIRRVQPDATITVVSDEHAPFYSRPGLAYLLTDDVPESQLTVRTPAEVDALRLERVAGRAAQLLHDPRVLRLDDGTHVPYDRLLIATGAASIRGEFPGAMLDGVVQLDDLAEAKDIVRRCASAKVAVVVGGGSTALELVDGLVARGVHTHYFLRGDRYWAKVFDPVESAIVESRLLAEGVVIHRHTSVREARGHEGVLTGVVTEAGVHVPCDMLAVAIGVRPRVDLAKRSGIQTDRGILTTEYLETSEHGIYAAGDVAQVYDPVHQLAQLDTLWSSAQQQGRIAGLNMAGVRVALRTQVPINVTRVGGVTVTIVGTVGNADDPDLLTLTRGQSERWITDRSAWSVGGARQGNRLRVVVSGRAIVGAVIMGEQTLSRTLAHLIGEDVDISALRPALEAAPNDAMDMLLDFCHAHVSDHAAPHG